MDKLREWFRRMKGQPNFWIAAGCLVAVIGLNLLLALSRPGTEETPKELSHWARAAEKTGSEITVNQMLAQLAEAEAGDKVALMGDKLAFSRGGEPTEDGAPISYIHVDNWMMTLFHAALLNTEAEIVRAVPQSNTDYTRWVHMVFLLMMMVLLVVMLKRSIPSNKEAFGVIAPNDISTTLADVAGIDVARSEIREVIDILRNPGKFEKIGARLPKGLLLYGPPGTGKTLLARAMAREAGVSFMSLDVSSLHQMYVGVGAMRVRSAFKRARKNAPCILFMDELDGIGRRTGGGDGADQERATTINTLLTELDGIRSAGEIFIIGATNRPENLDDALTRPGRIDRKLHINLPDRKGRLDILKVHCAKLRLGADVDLDVIAGLTPGMSGASLASICNEAALSAAREGREAISAQDFAQARDRALIGQTGGEIILSEDDRRLTAWHEAGHALTALMLPGTDKVEKISILPKGGALGYVLQVPDRDILSETRERLENRMVVLAAGRAAEALQFGEEKITTGAASDIRAITKIAHNMVSEWGMGRAGMISLSAFSDRAPLINDTELRDEVSRIAREAYSRALTILKENRHHLDALAHALLEKDDLSGEEASQIIGRAA